jgi:predicted dehydrogenase
MQAGATAAAAYTLASPRALGANERIRVAIIGCKNRGPQVAEPMAQSGAFEIATLCDCDTAMSAHGAKVLARIPGVAAKHEQDFRRVLDDPGIDAVVVAAPDHWHGAMTVMALEAGKHVYCEKPASYNIADGDAMLRAEAAHPKLVAMVGTQQRSGPHFKDALAFIQAGNLGTIGFGRAWITHNRGLVPRVPNTPPPASLDYDLWLGPAPAREHNPELTHYNWHWVNDLGTGEMGNWGAHWIDIARWYMRLGLPQAVTAHGGKFVQDDAKETPDTQHVLYEFERATLLWEQRIWTGTGTNGESSGAEIAGDKGSITITRGGWTFIPTEGKRERHPTSELMEPHVASFAAAIRGTGTVGTTLEDGVTTAALCHLGTIAMQTKSRVALADGKLHFGDNTAANALRHRPWRAPWAEHQPVYTG